MVELANVYENTNSLYRPPPMGEGGVGVISSLCYVRYRAWGLVGDPMTIHDHNETQDPMRHDSAIFQKWRERNPNIR
jgi:hypothetical protein